MGKSNKKAVTHLEIHIIQCRYKEEEKLQSSNYQTQMYSKPK
jgi:hypothetical protein